MHSSTNTLLIPATVSPSWETVFSIDICETGEAFTPLSWVRDQFLTRPIYHAAGIVGAAPECYARDTVRKKLLQANALLPKGTCLVVVDAWRGTDTQAALLEKCITVLRKMHPDDDEAAICEIADEFVARPSLGSAAPAPHSTGGAVDVTIATTKGEALFFGAPFDHPHPISNTRHFEERCERGETLNASEARALANRRLLYDVMIRSGFVNYHKEWWHFEYGTQRWAYITGERCALYGYKTPDAFDI